MPNALSPTERWFINLAKLQNCVKNLNHLTANDLKQFSKQTVKNLITSPIMEGQLSLFCQDEGIGLVPNGTFDDKTMIFHSFLEIVGVIPLETSLRFQVYSIAVKHNPDLINKSVANVMKMKLDDVFGVTPLDSNIGKKELDLVLNQITPDTFYPIDGSFLKVGTKKLTDVVKQIIS